MSIYLYPVFVSWPVCQIKTQSIVKIQKVPNKDLNMSYLTSDLAFKTVDWLEGQSDNNHIYRAIS